MRRLNRPSLDPSRASQEVIREEEPGAGYPTSIDRLPSMSKTLDKRSMTPVEAKLELETVNLDSRRDLLKTDDVTSFTTIGETEKPVPLADPPSFSIGDSDDEVSFLAKRALGTRAERAFF